MPSPTRPDPALSPELLNALASITPKLVPPGHLADPSGWRLTPRAARAETPPLTEFQRLLVAQVISPDGQAYLKRVLAGSVKHGIPEHQVAAKAAIEAELLTLSTHEDELVALTVLQLLQGREYQAQLVGTTLPVWLARAAREGKGWTPLLDALAMGPWEPRHPWPRHESYMSSQYAGWDPATLTPTSRGTGKGLSATHPVAVDEHLQPWIDELVGSGDRDVCKAVVLRTRVAYLHRQVAAQLPVADVTSLDQIAWWRHYNVETAAGLAANPGLARDVRRSWLDEILRLRLGPKSSQWNTMGSGEKAAYVEMQVRLAGWLAAEQPQTPTPWIDLSSLERTSTREMPPILAGFRGTELATSVTAVLEGMTQTQGEQQRGYRDGGTGTDYTQQHQRRGLLVEALERTDLDPALVTQIIETKAVPMDLVVAALQHPQVDPATRDAFLASKTGSARETLSMAFLRLGSQTGQWCPWSWVEPSGEALRSEDRLVVSLRHPEVSEAVILSALGLDTRDLRTALASSPVAQRHPRVRQALLRSTSAPIQRGLLLGSTDPEEYAALFYRYFQQEPRLAIEILAETPPPEGTVIPVGWIKPLLTDTDSIVRQLAVRALPRCVGGAEALQPAVRAPALRRKRTI